MDESWKFLDIKVIATILQYLAKNVYFNVIGEKIIEGQCKKFHDLYEKNTSSNKVFLTKMLYNHKMKEGTLLVENLNEFNIITNYLASIKNSLDDETRFILLMCSMPNNQDNLIVVMSTSITTRTLKFDDVSKNIINEELQCKSIAKNEGGEVLAMVDFLRIIELNIQGHLNSRIGRLTFFHCGKPRHKKRDSWIWKKQQKE